MSYQRLPRAEADERTAARVALAQARIESAVASIQSGGDWREFLRLQSRLHAYSAGNVWLIGLQHAAAFEAGLVDTPWQAYVAGFRTWKALGRSVDKGQHGYQILAPSRRTERGATDTQGHWRALAEGQDPYPWEDGASRPVIRGFRVEHVFAVEQASGAELASPPAPRLLQGQAPAPVGRHRRPGPVARVPGPACPVRRVHRRSQRADKLGHPPG